MFNNKIVSILIFLIIAASLVFAQGIGIRLNFIGYGKTVEEAYFTVHNSGEVAITDVSLYVDGKLYKTINAILSPKAGFETTLYLNSGEHLIEVKTPEGAYDSLKISIPKVYEKTTTTTSEETLFSTQRNNINKMIVIVSIVLTIFVIIAWLLTRKPKLGMEQEHS